MSERSEHLSRADTARWHMATPENPMVIGALLLLERRLTLDTLEGLVRAKLVPHPRFRQHVVESKHWSGRPSWHEDEIFELRDHVRQADVPRPLDADALVTFASARMSAPLPLDRSPWSVELVPVAPTGSALLVRIHHCIADGMALASLLEDLSDEGHVRPAAIAHATSTGAPGGARRLFGELGSLFRFLTLSGEPESSLRQPVGGQKRVAWSDSISLDAVKAIAHERGHHFAEVLLASVAGALDRYERERGEAPHAVRALLPVAVPPKASDGELGNHYASVFVRLPVAIADPQERLEAVAKEMATLRGQSASRMATGLVGLAGGLAPSVEGRAVRWWSKRASLVVSSLAGPPAPLHIAGSPLRAPFVWAPVPASIALSLTFFGYAGKLCVGALSDAAVLARPEELIAAFQAALDELGHGTARVAG